MFGKKGAFKNFAKFTLQKWLDNVNNVNDNVKNDLLLFTLDLCRSLNNFYLWKSTFFNIVAGLKPDKTLPEWFS